MHPAAARDRYLLALGSNLGERQQNLAAALAALPARGVTVVARAPLYETAPIGAADRPFLNSAAVVETALAPSDLLAVLLAVEAGLGRVRRERQGNRPVDLDILLWWPRGAAATAPLQTAHLVIPHAAMLERAFVMVPAAQIAPDWMHPHSGRTRAAERDARALHLPPGFPWHAAPSS
jgi:2-amino-4-hydroxy-6-hydroxymethyldihydropteridine diphosphokinase